MKNYGDKDGKVKSKKKWESVKKSITGNSRCAGEIAASRGDTGAYSD